MKIKKFYKSKMVVQGIIVLFFSLLAVYQFLPTTPDKAWGGEAENVKQITLKVDGMTCASCAPTIKMALKKLDGVLGCDVSVKKGKAFVDYEDGKVSIAQMIKRIENVGFKASLLSKEGNKL